MSRLPSVLVLAALATAACGEPVSVTAARAALVAASGATHPIVAPGDSITLEGQGFGDQQGGATIVFVGSSGPIPLAAATWADDAIITVVPGNAETGYLVVVLGPGDTLAPLRVTVRHPGAIDAGNLTWSAGPALPVALRAPQLVAFSYPGDTGLTGRLFVTGGVTSEGVQVASYVSDIRDAGTPGAWRAGDASIPSAYRFAGAATATQGTARLRRSANRDSTVEGVTYLLGGMDAAGNVVSDVVGLSVWQDGDQGAWTKLPALPDRRAGVAALVAYGNLFVVGGLGPDSVALPVVNVAVVDSFGVPTGWFAGPPLPEGRAFAAAAVHDHTLFIVGGEAGRIDPQGPDSAGLRGTVFAIRLSARTGFFAESSWRVLTTTLVAPRSRHATFATDGGLLVSVGVTAGIGPESEFASYDPANTLGPFAAVGGTTIAANGGGVLSEVGAAQYLDRAGQLHVVLVGGQSIGGAAVGRTWWH